MDSKEDKGGVAPTSDAPTAMVISGVNPASRYFRRKILFFSLPWMNKNNNENNLNYNDKEKKRNK